MKYFAMRKQVLAAFGLAALLMFSISASAGYCESINGLAETVMTKRQQGFQMERVYNAVQEEYAQEMVVDAYDYPLYQTNEYKNQAVNEFASKWFRLCLKATND